MPTQSVKTKCTITMQVPTGMRSRLRHSVIAGILFVVRKRFRIAWTDGHLPYAQIDA
jgi:hypothetical protein